MVTISLQPELWRPTPLAALELTDIPSAVHFVRDHFPAPTIDPAAWSVELAGTAGSLVLDLDRLRALPRRTLSVVLECAGHRRAEFDPVPSGVPWACGAVAEARWTGASLGPLLRSSGIPSDALEVVLEGADSGPVAGFEGMHRFARSLPLAEAVDHDVLLAYEMNGEPIAIERGGPVRAIVPGWYATDSVKWLERVWFSDREFNGVFQAHDYRLRAPGESGPGSRMTEVPAHALITTPIDGECDLSGGEVSVRGVAWGGTGGIADVLVRVDEGEWGAAHVGPERGRYARVFWDARLMLRPGEHEIACRAIDWTGGTQPDAPPPNVRGYGNNAVHRIRLRAL